MTTKIVIGTPPLGEQIQEVLVGRMKSSDVVIQTSGGWVTIPNKLAVEVSSALVLCAAQGSLERGKNGKR